MDDLKYWVALSGIPQLGAARFRRLEGYFGDLELAWRAGISQLREAGLDSRTAQEVASACPLLDPDDIMARLERAGVSATNWNCDDYPPRLKQISDPPPVLYYLGEIVPQDEWSVAIVGTRNPTSYGREAATVLSRDLASAGITVVSGLALGIDGAAHRAALECGGRTIAVVAGGLDSVYPKEHSGLFRQIRESGAVVSEHRLGVRPDARNFPRRNRLISGMTLGTVVVEAAEGSGTRWTVQQALEQDREVFCVPGSIFSPASRGTNRLIQEGAKLVYDYNDILEELNLSVVTQQLEMELAPLLAQVPQDDNESALLGHLDDQPLHIDDIRRRSSLPIASVSGLLTMLELKGLVRQVGCMHYVRMREATSTYGD